MVRGAIPAVRYNAPSLVSKKRFPVYATDEQVSDNEMPIEWVMEAYNHQVYGDIPEDDKLPNNAFYGWVYLAEGTFAEDSVWTLGQDGRLLRVVSPRVLDHPLVFPSDALDDNFLKHLLDAIPVHTVRDVHEPFVYDKELAIHINEELFESIPRVGKFTLDLCGNLASLVLERHGELREFNRLSLVCGERERRYAFCGDIVTVINRNHEPVLFPSVLQRCGKDIRKRLILHCGESVL